MVFCCKHNALLCFDAFLIVQYSFSVTELKLSHEFVNFIDFVSPPDQPLFEVFQFIVIF